jgi:uncharacterized RDD family membrane protein YckC
VGFSLKNMGSAQLDILAFDEQPAIGMSSQATSLGLRQQAAERLAAHRQRRNHAVAAAGVATEAHPRRIRHNPIVAAVAERYAHTPSYRAFLAEQAQRAMEEAARQAESAAAEAEIAARNASAIAVAQQQLLAELDLWNAPQKFTPETAETVESKPSNHPGASHRDSEMWVPKSSAASRPKPTNPVKEVSSTGLTVRLFEDLGPQRTVPASTNAPQQFQDFEEARALDEEILFRQAPVFEPFSIEPLTPLPANLLEFPRQLVATRKARPRVAEGPLLDDAPARSPQLRIFEVEPEQISTTPAPASRSPEWASIHLDAQTTTAPLASAVLPAPALSPSLLPPQTAPLELRLMAAAVDMLLVAGGFVASVAVVAQIAHRIPSGINAAIAAAATLGLFWPLYQLFFFTLSDQTPGMRYARIGLCTLSDENPTRSAMRRRILAQLIAVVPFGLGILWALLDDDGLGWHDRISRMYQRAY